MTKRITCKHGHKLYGCPECCKGKPPVRSSELVRPQWTIGQTVRHKLTGELFAVEAINDDYADLRPLISKITVTKWGFSHWEAAV